MASIIPYRNKPYKDKKPLATITQIRNILNKIGIFVSEKSAKHGNFYACRIEIANENLSMYHIGTNGKGTTLEYAFASAYAEFMERLQNDILLDELFYFSKYNNQDSAFKKRLQKENLVLDFIYEPTEVFRDSSEIADKNFDILSIMFGVKDKNELTNFITDVLGYQGDICIPFFNVSNHSVVYLPRNIVYESTSSTGMCAGNTPEEALVQGLSEILERYALSYIYFNNITPPTIPHDYFYGYSVYDLIKELENCGFTIIIKDISLGKKLPVVGVIIIDNKTLRYNIKLGADPWPVTALERCLTEFHQSLYGIRLIDKSNLRLSLSNFNNSLNINESNILNLTLILNKAEGQWPDSIFFNNSSYSFTGLNYHCGINNNEDARYLIDLIHDLGSTVLIRDVSYLGFNSYYIIAPGLTQEKKQPQDFRFLKDFYGIFMSLNHIDKVSKKTLYKIDSILRKYYYLVKNNYINWDNIFKYNNEGHVVDLSIDLLLCLINYKLGRTNQAYHYIDNYLKNKAKDKFLYYYGCKDFLALLLNKHNHQEIQNYLNLFYGEALSQEIIKDMSIPDCIFDYYDFNSYFTCKNCDINNFEYYKVSAILKTIESIKKNNMIKQENLNKLFS